MLGDLLVESRQLDRGNAQPARLGADFGRFDFDFWAAMRAHDPQNQARKAQLELMNEWRNAIVHQDFSRGQVHRGGRIILAEVRGFQRVCQALVVSMDAAVGAELHAMLGRPPW